MRKQLVRAVFGASAGLFLITALPARADTLLGTPTDNYYGGLDNGGYGDVIGDANIFNTTGAVVTRSADGNTLTVKINTNFAGAPGTGPADGTGYGSLFITPNGAGPSGISPYTTNVYSPGQWTYAVTIAENPGSGSQSGTGGLFSITGSETANPYTAHGADGSVAQSYNAAAGTVVMSNVSGNGALNDPVSYPTAGNNAFYFRQGQAVEYDPTSPTATVGGTSATWAVVGTTNVEGSITFTIVDNGLLGDNFALAWAMTCANDAFEAVIGTSGAPNNPAPLPATALLMGTVLGAGGLVGRWRRRKQQAAA